MIVTGRIAVMMSAILILGYGGAGVSTAAPAPVATRTNVAAVKAVPPVRSAAVPVAQPAVAQPSTQRPMDSTVSNSGDYATDAFGDAWDFNNSADLTPMMTGLSVGISGLHLQPLSATNSVLAGTAAPGSYLMLSGTAPHVLPWGRDPRLYPIDAGVYTQLTISMYSSASMAAGAFYLTCIDGPSSCYNGSPWSVKAGWNTYTIDLSKATTYYPTRPRWSGEVGMLRLGFNPSSTTSFDIDWIRLGTAGTTGLNPTQPQPSILSPSDLGGADYATTVRGRPWNLQSPGDVGLVGIGDVSYSADGVRGKNIVSPATPLGNDPHLNLPVPTPINGSVYNQMEISVCYDGKFALTGAPGGGMNGRVIWKIAGESFPRNSQDFLVFPGCQTIDLDLSGPASVVEDETDVSLPGGQRGFAGQSIVGLRFDPDEDPGPRYFTVSSIRLTAAVTAPRALAINYADNNWQGATTADLWLDATGSGTHLVPIATGKPVADGVNTFAWLGRDTSDAVVSGQYYLRLRLTNRTGSTTVYSSTKVTVGPAPGAPGPVSGVQATAGRGTVNVSWSPPTTGGPALAYLVQASNGQTRTVTSPARSATFPSLADGTAYSFTVTAANGSGTSSASATAAATPAATAGSYLPLTAPERLLDTRRSTPVPAGATLDVQVAGGIPGLPAAGISSVALNVTAVGSTAAGYLTVFPSGQARPATSSLNFEQGVDTANMVVAKLGANGRISIFNSSGTTDVLVDVVGYYSDGRITGATYFPLSPSRVLDTRNGTGVSPSAIPAGGSTSVRVTGVGGVPSSGVSAVVLNIAGVLPTAGTFLTVWPAGEARPTVSDLNLRAGDTRANLVTVRVGAGGRIALFNAAGSVQVIADVVGWFGAAGNLSGASLLPLTPYRVFDSRPQSATSLPPTPIVAGSPQTINLTGPASGVPVGAAKAVLANVTSVGANTDGFVTMWPAGEAQPGASTINLRAGEVRPNLVSERLPGDGNAQVAVSGGSTDLIVDVVAWYG